MQSLKDRLLNLSALNYVNLVLTFLLVVSALPAAWRTVVALRAVPDQLDYATYYLAAAVLNSDHPVLYRNDLLYATASDREVKEFAPPYVYPPFFATALRPLAMLPYDAAKAWWYAINVSFLILSLFLLIKLASCPIQSVWLILGGLLIALFPPVHQALLLGQVSPLLLLLCTGCLHFAVEPANRCRQMAKPAGGLLLALAAFVKVFPALLLPYSLITKRLRLVTWSLVGSLACLVLGIIGGGGIENTLNYFGSFLPSLYGQRLGIVHPYNQSLSAFFMRLFTPATSTVALLSKENWHVVEFAPFIESKMLALILTYISSVLVLAVTALAALQVGRKPFNKDRWALGFSLIVVAGLLVISSAFYHLYVLLLLPLAILVRTSATLKRQGILTLALVVYLLTVVCRYSNWLAVLTSSALFVSLGLYAVLLLWGGIFYLLAFSSIADDVESEREVG